MSRPASTRLGPSQFGVFAKHWTPGRVKTRLAAAIGPDAAAGVAKAFVETLLTRFGGCADRCVIGFSPPDTHAAFSGLAGQGWELAPQCDGDLGVRMRHYFETSFAAGAERVVLVGADSPNLPHGYVQEALERLENQRLVLGPTDDGGYYLIGARGEPPPVLNAMPFSTEALWRTTVDHLQQLGWTRDREWSALPAWYDVDTIDDLHRLESELVETNDDALTALANRLKSAHQP